MKPSLIITLILAITLCGNTYSMNNNYNPLTKKEIDIQKKSFIKSKDNSSLSYKYKPVDVHSALMRYKLLISIDGIQVYNEEKEFYPRYIYPIIANFDNNGYDDLFFNGDSAAQGLHLGCSIIFYLQDEKKKFKKVSLNAEQFDKEDIFDIDGDDKYEIITCELVKHNSHSYWLYRCWQARDCEIVNVDKKFGFPRAIWFTIKPNKKLIDSNTLKGIMETYFKK